jgi:hypothetical protein
MQKPQPAPHGVSAEGAAEKNCAESKTREDAGTEKDSEKERHDGHPAGARALT